MKRLIKIFLSLTLVFITVLACKEDTIIRVIDIETLEVTNITATSAQLNGEIIDIGEGIIDYGAFYHTKAIAQNGLKISEGSISETGEFTVRIDNLAAGTKYNTKVYASDGLTVIYGLETTFITLNGLSDLTTNKIEDITGTTATCGGKIYDDGGAEIIARGVCWSSTEDPTILDNHTVDGNGNGDFTSNITGLTAHTTYYVRAYATNSVGTVYGEQDSFTPKEIGTLTDYDGNTYGWVRIGTQDWMRQNLKVTHYPDGTEITEITSSSEWEELKNNDTDDAYCFIQDYESKGYGLLYSYAAAINGNSNDNSNQGVCPDGWHLPSDDEWTTLIEYVMTDGYSGKDGVALKSTYGWVQPDNNGIDHYGFCALASGFSYYSAGSAGFLSKLWSGTSSASINALTVVIGGDQVSLHHPLPKSCGHSVRCVRD